MNIDFTGSDVTDALRNFTEEKFSRLTKLHAKIISIKVIFDVQKLTHKAEATILIPKHEIFAHAEAEDMYAAVDALTDKLAAQIKKHKDKERDH